MHACIYVCNNNNQIQIGYQVESRESTGTGSRECRWEELEQGNKSEEIFVIIFHSKYVQTHKENDKYNI